MSAVAKPESHSLLEKLQNARALFGREYEHFRNVTLGLRRILANP